MLICRASRGFCQQSFLDNFIERVTLLWLCEYVCRIIYCSVVWRDVVISNPSLLKSCRIGSLNTEERLLLINFTHLLIKPCLKTNQSTFIELGAVDKIVFTALQLYRYGDDSACRNIVAFCNKALIELTTILSCHHCLANIDDNTLPTIASLTSLHIASIHIRTTIIAIVGGTIAIMVVTSIIISPHTMTTTSGQKHHSCYDKYNSNSKFHFLLL